MRHQNSTSRKVRRLRQLRREREWTQAYLGERVGLSASTINEIERGLANPSFDKGLEIAALFSLTAEEVFALVEIPDGPSEVVTAAESNS